MSTTDVRLAVDAIHMRVTYFAASAEQANRPHAIEPADVAAVFGQLDRLLDYAGLVQAPSLRGIGAASVIIGDSSGEPRAGGPEVSTRHLNIRMMPSGTFTWGPPGPPPPTTPGPLSGEIIIRPTGSTRPVIVSVRMGSPLEVLFEIPMVAWPGIGFGLLALAERIATSRVRISRKRKEELLRAAIIETETARVNEVRADVLGQLLLADGRQTETRPDEVAFVDPEATHDELVPVVDTP